MDIDKIRKLLAPHVAGYRLVVDEQLHGDNFKASLVDGELYVSAHFSIAAIDEPELLKACADVLVSGLAYYQTEEK